MARQTESTLPFLLSRDALISRAVPGIGELRVLLASAPINREKVLKMVGGLALRSAAHSGW